MKPRQLNGPQAGVLRELLRVVTEWITLAALPLLGRKHGIDGFPVVFFTDDAAVDPSAVGVLRSGVDLLRSYDPRALQRVQRDLKRVIVFDAALSEFRPTLRAAVISLDDLLTLTAEDAALFLIHEATHGRLWARGFRPTTHDQARVEAVCVGREKAFAQRLPNSSELVTKLDQRLSVRWWEPEQHRRRMERQLRKLRGPLDSG